jgi:two-component system, chemotaxis family, chemotaxis protein CheY
LADAAEEAKMERYSFENASLLLVDDSIWMRAVIRKMVRTLGFTQIYEADCGENALARVIALQPDIILTDWDMKPMNGLELTFNIRRLDSPVRFTPIIMVSAYNTLSNIIAARNAGITEYLVKPVSPAALYKRFVAVIERPRPIVEAAGYIGPDRRRHKDDNGPLKRRQVDMDLADLDPNYPLSNPPGKQNARPGIASDVRANSAEAE